MQIAFRRTIRILAFGTIAFVRKMPLIIFALFWMHRGSASKTIIGYTFVFNCIVNMDYAPFFIYGVII